MGKRKLEEVDTGDDSSQIESDDSCCSSNSATTNSSADVPSGTKAIKFNPNIPGIILAHRHVGPF